MKMRNIILDTNAFIYLFNYGRGKANKICVEGKNVRDKKLHDLCINSNHLFVTGQTLYELFWQSFEKTNDINEFALLYDAIAKYRQKFKVKFSILNDVNGMFNINLFEKQYRCGNVDIDYFVNEKRIYEKKKLEIIILTLYAAAMGVVFEHCQVNLENKFFNSIKTVITIKLDEISDAYYSFPGTPNEQYDLAIEQLLEEIWKVSVEHCRVLCEPRGILLPKIKYGKGGTVFMHKFFCELKRIEKNIMIKYSKYLDEICEGLKSKGEYEESCKYLKYICQRSIINEAKIRKNDGLDFSIVTCLAKDNIKNETGNSIDLNNTYAITFDRNLYKFTKENNVLYNKKVYDELID